MKKFKVTYTRSSTLKQGRIYSEYELRRYFGKIRFDTWNGKAYCWNKSMCTQIEEVKEMEFKKSDLVAGKHVVVLNSGKLGLVMGDWVQWFKDDNSGNKRNANKWSSLDWYDCDLKSRASEDKNVVKVYSITGGFFNGTISFNSCSNLVWERNEAQEEIAKLEQDIAELQEIHKRQIAKLEEQLEQLR